MRSLLLFLLLAIAAHAGTIQSNGSGKWDSLAVWKGGVLPSDTDQVEIMNGHTITVNTDNIVVRKFTVHTGATVLFDGQKNRSLSSTGDIIVESGGTIAPSATFSTGDALNNLQVKGNLIVDGTIVQNKFGLLSGSRTINYIVLYSSVPPANTFIGGTGSIGAVSVMVAKGTAAETVFVKPGVTLTMQTLTHLKGTLDNRQQNFSVVQVQRYDNASNVTALPGYTAQPYVSYPGAASLTTGAELPDTVGNLYMITAAKTVTLHKDLVVKTNLFLNDGRVNTGNFTLKVNGTVSNAGTERGFVIGKLEKPVGNDSMKLFEVGSSNGYAEVLMKFHKLVGGVSPRSLTVSTAAAQHPAMKDTLLALRRHWTITLKGTIDYNSFDLTLRYTPADFVNGVTEKGSENALLVAQYNLVKNVQHPTQWEVQKPGPGARDTSGAGGTIFAGGLSNLPESGTLQFALLTSSSALAVTPRTVLPAVFALQQNYPNPFNPSTTLRFTVERSGPASLAVYDMVGREVARLAEGEFAAGTLYERRFNASSLASGVYFAKLTSNGRSQIRSMLFVK